VDTYTTVSQEAECGIKIMALPERTNKELEARRREALRATNRGVSPQKIAEVLDVDSSSLHRWKRMYDEEGKDGIASTSRKKIERHLTEQRLNEAIDEAQSTGEAHLVRRLCFVKNLYSGDNTVEAASRVGMSDATGVRWSDAWNKEGVEELRPNWDGGRPPKLSKDKLPELEELLQRGAESFGYVGDRWTSRRVKEVIEQEFGVSVHPVTAGEYMHELEWSYKMVQRRGLERDEEAIEAFRAEDWHQIREEAKQEDKTIVFVDESKFSLLPPFRSTWAPIGEVPIVETASSYDSLSAIGAVTYTPSSQEFALEFRTQHENYNTRSVLPFLSKIAYKLPREPVFVMDNWSPHKSSISVLKDDSAKTRMDIRAEYFPEYSSDLNPADRVWGLAKNDLANCTAESLDELEEKVVSALKNIRSDKAKLRYCVKDAGLKIEA
jgi:transposase